MSWPKVHDGYADAVITNTGIIDNCLVKGEYPATIDPSFFEGKSLDDIQGIVDGTPYIMAAVLCTIRTGRGVPVQRTFRTPSSNDSTIFHRFMGL
ncbi:hypothetical protein DSCA_62870 [Desulfosarcina alkanivorans]|uniref:Uncharacterized protein n=1 Tax=Desulfosarcina alkanivorans TaxID=571177 RepID=A0A5K7Z766_9BACT|nr:hypothetical protein DSCA_62870 [Desulfosarcina alkanivorans]